MTKGIIYYTDNRLDDRIARRVRAQIKLADLPIVSTSLEPIDFGRNIVMSGKPGSLTMFRQQLAALEASSAEIIFFCEHDVLYHPSHFDYTPADRGTFYYNVNVWKVRSSDGHAVRVDSCKQVSGLCGFRTDLVRHYRERVALTEQGLWRRGMGFEPGVYAAAAPWAESFKVSTWESPEPNLDIRHTGNMTQNRWDPALFQDKSTCAGWTESDTVPYWGKFTL